MNTVRLIALVNRKFTYREHGDEKYSIGTVRYNRPGNTNKYDIIPVIVRGNNAAEVSNIDPGCLIAIKNAYLQTRTVEESGKTLYITEVVAYGAAFLIDPPAADGEYDSLMDNSICLTGRWTKDLLLKYTPSSIAVCTGSLAVDRYKSSEKQTDFFPIVLFDKQAESTSKHTSKGYLVGLEGRIQVRNYQKDGVNRIITEIATNKIDFLSKPFNGKNNNGGASNYNNSNNTPFNEVPFNEDDLPF